MIHVGATVLYLLREPFAEEYRPAKVTKVWDAETGCCNLTVFHDETDDEAVDGTGPIRRYTSVLPGEGRGCWIKPAWVSLEDLRACDDLLQFEPDGVVSAADVALALSGDPGPTLHQLIHGEGADRIEADPTETPGLELADEEAGAPPEVDPLAETPAVGFKTPMVFDEADEASADDAPSSDAA